MHAAVVTVTKVVYWFTLLLWHSSDGKYASQPRYMNSVQSLVHYIYAERSLRETQGCWALLSEQDFSMLLSGCVIKVLREGWSPHGSSGLHMWPGLIVVPWRSQVSLTHEHGLLSFCLCHTLNGQHMAADNANCSFYPGLTSQGINKPSQTLGASFCRAVEERARLGFLLQGH